MDEPRKKRIRKTKAERQREIVEATLKLISKYGVQGTTVARITSAIGLVKGALYQHFPNRHAVLVAALDVLGQHSSTWISQQTPGTNAMDSLLGLVHAHSHWSPSEYEAFVRPFFQLVASADQMKLTPQVSERVEKDWRTLVRRVEEAQKQGDIPESIDAEDMAWGIMMFLWAEDLAQLMGVDHLFIRGGASRRNIDRLMASYMVGRSLKEPPA